MTLILIIVQVSQVDEYLSSAWVPQALRIMVVLLLVQRLKESAGGIEETIALATNAETMMAMLKLLFKILVLIHILSLVLNLMAEAESYWGQPITWLSANNFDVGSQFERYVAGWYWGATILSSVGFGDITPSSIPWFNSDYIERFIISFVQILCCMSFGYFVNVIGSLIRLRTEQDEKYEKESRFLNRYLNALTLTQDLKLKVRSHFQNKHKVEKTLDSAEQQTVLENLTPVLKSSLLEENNITVLKKSSQFEHMREQALTRLARVLKRVMFAPEHIIYSRESSEMKLWLLESGEVNEYTHHFGDSHFEKKIASYDPNDSAIGWSNFLTQRKYTTVARASEFTVAY